MSDKPNYSYIPPRALEEVAKVFTDGARKHSPFGWVESPETPTHMHGAAQRHISEWRMGRATDLESGHHPLAHAITRLLMLLAYDLKETEWKDGPRPLGNETASEVQARKEAERKFTSLISKGGFPKTL
jgi:hypothetical protein